MLDRYRIVCVTPAGRRRYLGILARQILACPLVDEYQLWRNTTDRCDIEFMRQLQTADPRIRIVEPTLLLPGTNASIRQFYRSCIDPETIYIRFDDDVVFLEPDFFSKFVRFRIDNPQYFVVFPNIINNAVCTYIQAVRGTIRTASWIHPWCMDLTTWGNPHFAEQLHRSFLNSAAAGTVSRWYFGVRLLALSRFSINCMGWFGRDFASFGGEVLGDEEEYVSVIKPMECMRSNCIYGDTIVSHFAFHPQRAYLDSINLLQDYEALVKGTSPALSDYDRPCDGDLWTPRLLDTLDRLANAAVADLKNVGFVANQIRRAGLVRDHRLLYGSDNRYMNTERVGLWQIPEQLAGFLVQMSNYEISRIIDVGTGSGWTTSIITAYLKRFNKEIQVLTVDVNNYFDAYSAVKRILPIDFQPGKTAKDYASQSFDLAFLDAEHSYQGCRAEYDAVGCKAKICAFHNIQDRFVSEVAANDGGVPRLWRELKSRASLAEKAFEFLQHSNKEMVMGIGVLVRGSV